jgi:leucyl aminopeptidase
VATSGSDGTGLTTSDWRPARPPEITLAAADSGALDRRGLALLVRPAADAADPADPADAVAAVSAAGARIAAELGLDVAALLRNEKATGAAGEVVTVPLDRAAPRRLFLVGRGDGTPTAARAAGAALSRKAGVTDDLAVVLDAGTGITPATTRSLAEGFALAAYRVAPAEADAADAAGGAEAAGGADAAGGAEAQVTGAIGGTDAVGPASAGRAVVFHVDDPAEPARVRALELAAVVARAVYLARDLVNTPSLVKTPEWLAARAVEVAASSGLTARVIGPDALAAGGFGGLLAVGAGSPRGPRLVELSYRGPAAEDGSSPSRTLVGKGITFDSGGLSLKPAGSMMDMKTDMSGAAAVLGAMSACVAFGVPGEVRGLLCLAENMIDGGAMRPGDVITIRGGRTVEVLNTDAEGRLVLADGLAYALESGRPDALIDIATLTGAVSVALGRRTAGLFASDDGLATALSTAAAEAGERVWRLPLVEEYRPAINSPVADLANIGRALEVSGGSITAALFLREFTAGAPWAHLDIANTARSDGDDGEISKGGTGWGVRTLLTWLLGAPAGRAASAGGGGG